MLLLSTAIGSPHTEQLEATLAIREERPPEQGAAAEVWVYGYLPYWVDGAFEDLHW